MRLDLFLKSSRLVLRRSIARELCDAGRVAVNGSSAKASKEVNVGDEIEIVRGLRQTTVKVLEVPNTKQVSRQKAASLIDLISDERSDDPLLP